MAKAGETTYLDYKTDGGLGHIASIGFINLSGDQTIEYEAHKILDIPGVALYATRVFNPSIVTAENLIKMEGRITDAARLINTVYPPNVVAFGCTSGAMVIGADKVAEKVKEAVPDAKVTDPMTAVVAAFAKLGVRRVALITPYSQTITDQMADYLRKRDLAVNSVAIFSNRRPEENIVRAAPFIEPRSMIAGIAEIGRDSSVDGVFVACTSLRAAEIIEEAERQIGKPVIAANHALMWHALRLTGYQTPLEGWGRLFRQ